MSWTAEELQGINFRVDAEQRGYDGGWWARSNTFVFCHLCDAPVSLDQRGNANRDHYCAGEQLFLCKPFGTKPYDVVSPVIRPAAAWMLAPLVLWDLWVEYGSRYRFINGTWQETTNVDCLHETFQEWFSRMNGFYFVRTGELVGHFREHAAKVEIVTGQPVYGHPTHWWDWNMGETLRYVWHSPIASFFLVTSMISLLWYFVR